MAKAAFHSRQERPFRGAGAVGARWPERPPLLSPPVDFHGPRPPQIMPWDPHFHSSVLSQSPELDNEGCDGGTSQSGCKGGRDPRKRRWRSAILRAAAALLAAGARGNLSKCAGLRIIGARSGGGSVLLPWRVRELGKVLPFAQVLPPLWSWPGTDREGLFVERNGGFRFFLNLEERWWGRQVSEKPSSPAALPSAQPSSTACWRPGRGNCGERLWRCGSCRFQTGSRTWWPFRLDPQASPTPQLPRRAGTGLRGSLGRRRRTGRGSERSESRGRIWRLDTGVYWIDRAT